MQMVLRNRETVTGTVTVVSTVVDVSNMPLLTAIVVVYAVSGTGPTITIQLQTCDDLETWQNVGSTFKLRAAGMQKAAFTAQNDVYGRYIRCQIAVAGTNPLFNFSLWLNAFPST